MNLATADLFHAEIARLQAEIELLRGYRDEAEAEASIASLAARRLRLTDAEREAVACAADRLDNCGWSSATLRGLLDRLSPINTAESDRPEAIATPEPQCTPAECTVPLNCTKTGGK